MATKPYTPLASYAQLKQVEEAINKAATVDQLREVMVKHGPKIGYKAFCYMFGGTMTPEAMKPDEACVVAVMLEQQNKADEAQEIYKKVVEAHPEHPIAKSKV